MCPRCNSLHTYYNGLDGKQYCSNCSWSGSPYSLKKKLYSGSALCPSVQNVGREESLDKKTKQFVMNVDG